MGENEGIGDVIWVSRCVDLKSEVWLRCTSRLESITDLKWPLSMHINLEKSEMNTFSTRTDQNRSSEHLLQRIVNFYLNKANLKNFTAIAGLLEKGPTSFKMIQLSPEK